MASITGTLRVPAYGERDDREPRFEVDVALRENDGGVVLTMTTLDGGEVIGRDVTVTLDIRDAEWLITKIKATIEKARPKNASHPRGYEP